MNEKYTFKFTQAEVKEIGKEVRNHKKGIALQLCFVVIFVGLLFLSFISHFISDIMQGIFIGVLVVYILILSWSYVQNRKLKKFNSERISGSTYEYEFFEDYVRANISDGTSTRTVNMKYSDIMSVKNCDTLYRIEYDNMYYFLRKKDLIPNAKIKNI